MTIESKMKELPENKRKIIREKEMRKRRLELKEAKQMYGNGGEERIKM